MTAFVANRMIKIEVKPEKKLSSDYSYISVSNIILLKLEDYFCSLSFLYEWKSFRTDYIIDYLFKKEKKINYSFA